MQKSFKDVLKHRRSYYSITNQSPISDEEIERIINFAVTHVPSAFKIVTPEAFKNTESKIDNCFESGYGTVLFFEDQYVVQTLQDTFVSYKDNFPGWSLQTSAMHQLAIWSMLEDAGFGASLQHYNPLIDEEVRRTWELPASWHLIAEMPFGMPVGEPGDKEFKALSERVKVFK